MLRVVYQHLQIHRMKFKTLDVVEAKTTTKLTFRNGLHVLGVIDQHLQIHEISNFRRYGSKDDNKTGISEWPPHAKGRTPAPAIPQNTHFYAGGAKTTRKLAFQNGLHVIGVVQQHRQIHEISNFRRYRSKDDNKTDILEWPPHSRGRVPTPSNPLHENHTLGGVEAKMTTKLAFQLLSPNG